MHGQVDGLTNIWVMGIDGSAPTQLTFGSSVTTDPRWTPDGTHIVFTSDIDGKGIYAMDTRGQGVHRITPIALGADHPDVSPDGRRVVFFSNGNVPHSSILTTSINGGALRQLTNPPSDRDDIYARYALRGNKIVFSSDRAGESDLYVMRRNGSDLHPITSGCDCSNLLATWAPVAPG